MQSAAARSRSNVSSDALLSALIWHSAPASASSPTVLAAFACACALEPLLLASRQVKQAAGMFIYQEADGSKGGVKGVAEVKAEPRQQGRERKGKLARDLAQDCAQPAVAPAWALQVRHKILHRDERRKRFPVDA